MQHMQETCGSAGITWCVIVYSDQWVFADGETEGKDLVRVHSSPPERERGREGGNVKEEGEEGGTTNSLVFPGLKVRIGISDQPWVQLNVLEERLWNRKHGTQLQPTTLKPQRQHTEYTHNITQYLRV